MLYIQKHLFFFFFLYLRILRIIDCYWHDCLQNSSPPPHVFRPLGTELLSSNSSLWSGNLLWGIMFSLSWRWHLDHSVIYSASFNSLKNSGGMGGKAHICTHPHTHEYTEERMRTSWRRQTSTLGTKSIITHLSALQFTPDDFTQQPIYWKRLNSLEHNNPGN